MYRIFNCCIWFHKFFIRTKLQIINLTIFFLLFLSFNLLIGNGHLLHFQKLYNANLNLLLFKVELKLRPSFSGTSYITTTLWSIKLSAFDTKFLSMQRTWYFHLSCLFHIFSTWSTTIYSRLGTTVIKKKLILSTHF